MLFLLSIFLFVQECCLSCLGSDVDFCNPKMCPYQGTHVACNKTKDFSSDCQGEPILENMKPFITMILDEHNYYRNLTAAGELKCFYPAVKMPVVEWDWDLAETAEYNVRSCVFAHDHCRSTTKFPFAGQNIYMAKTARVNESLSSFIKEAMFLWFEEQYYANNDILQSYRKSSPQIGHFTLMVSDRQSKMGCAMCNTILPGFRPKRSMIFTCNYSSTNIRGMPSYKFGPTASQCKKRHKIYTALCVDPTDSNDLKRYDVK